MTNLKDLSPTQQSKLFIFERWAVYETATDVIMLGIDSNGDLKILFKLPKAVLS